MRNRGLCRACCLLCAAVLLATACGVETETGGEDRWMSVIDGEALLARVSAGTAPLVLDVRTAEEYASGHVPGAVNIAHDVLPERLEELAASVGDEIVVYCERGGRAAAAEETLAAAGFLPRHLEGDMSEWRDAGRPTETGD